MWSTIAQCSTKLLIQQFLKFSKLVLEHLAKTYLGNTFKQVSVYLDDFELLGFKIENLFYLDKTLLFGLSYSCNFNKKLRSGLQWILENSFSLFMFWMFFYLLGHPINLNATVLSWLSMSYLGIFASPF